MTLMQTMTKTQMFTFGLLFGAGLSLAHAVVSLIPVLIAGLGSK